MVAPSTQTRTAAELREWVLPKHVHVTWLDSCGGDWGWAALDEDFSPAEALECRTVGFIIHESDTSVQLAQNITMGRKEQGAPPQFTGSMTIPKCAIVTMQEL